ncbi:MAG TPA: hypothetical protein VGO52_00625 [Hyphomonadaceae bacterium]|jgi:hypothetical protein|nr:hypothetical protein [Hyphomonadaceae bacterium]
MKASVIMVAARALAASAHAQQAPPAQDLPKGENVTVTGEEREDVFKQQIAAERAAGEARKAFAGLKNGQGDAAFGCRKAAEANREYRQAITETQALANDAGQPLKAKLEERIKGMKERRDNLDDFQGKICDGSGMPKAQRKGAARIGKGKRP